VRIKDVTASNRYLEKTTERLSELGKGRKTERGAFRNADSSPGAC